MLEINFSMGVILVYTCLFMPEKTPSQGQLGGVRPPLTQ